jgi:hypothetical protein
MTKPASITGCVRSRSTAGEEAVVSATTIALAAAFNLVCAVGETRSTTADGTGSTDKDVTIVFHVDLDRKLWCTGDCAIVRPIASLTDRHINFAYAEDETVPALLSIQTERDPWILNSSSQTGNAIVVSLGPCKQTAFTGFPLTSQPPGL